MGRDIDPPSLLVESDERGTVIRISGDVDATSAPALRTVLADAIEVRPARLQVDLAGVDFIDSVGLSVLVAGHRRGLEHGVPFELARVRPACMRVLEITRLTEVFTIAP
jgi:anti-sigma B factor antagonist